MEKTVYEVIRGWTCCNFGKGRRTYCQQCPYDDNPERDYRECSMRVAMDVNKLLFENKVCFYAIPEGDVVLTEGRNYHENCRS